MANSTESDTPPPGKGGPDTGHHIIHFWLDGDPYETRRHELTPNEIIRQFGGLDPATHYLVEIEGRDKGPR